MFSKTLFFYVFNANILLICVIRKSVLNTDKLVSHTILLMFNTIFLISDNNKTSRVKPLSKTPPIIENTYINVFYSTINAISFAIIL